MQKIMLVSILCCFITTLTLAQSSKRHIVSNIQSLLMAEHPDQHDTVIWKDGNSALQIGRYLIPVSDDTHIQIDRENKSYKVAFLLQKGTAVTDTGNAEFRRAYWTIPFSTKKACREFVCLFEQLKAK